MKNKIIKINPAYFLLMLLIPLGVSSAQIGGISGSKLLVPDAEPVEKGKFEFEPTLSVFSYSKEFDSLGKQKSLNGHNSASSLDFRITLGAMEGLEVGTSFCTDMQEILLGSKAVLFTGDKTAMALLAGVTLPAGNRSVGDTLNNPPSIYSFSLGAAASNKISDKSSLDLFFSYSRYENNPQYSNALNFGASFGFWSLDNLQAIVEMDGYSAFSSTLYSSKISLVPGFTYTFSEKLILVLGDQIDLWGKNDFKGSSIFSSFTMSF
ncbi:MAG TPA: transporter [Ignavibacteriales bacterium]|nr:transporter [Ignavibacteriales bacterium]